MQLFKTVFIVLLFVSVNYGQAWAIQTCGDKGTCKCTLELDDKNINFKFNPLMNTAHEAVFHISVTCVLHQKGSEEVDYKIHFAPGHSDNIKYRHMHGGGKDILTYNIHQDHQHTLILGDGLGGMVEIVHKYTLKQHTHHNHNEHYGEHSHQSPQTDHYAIHLQIPAQPFAKIGQYSDSFIVTLTY